MVSPFQADQDAAALVAAELAKPLPTEQWEEGCDEFFDPWNLFHSVYGSYSSDFDDMAILVLSNLHQRNFDGEGLAHHMFREMLCTAHLCDYGTSPRVCFPTTDFRPLLPALLEKWQRYRERWVRAE